MSHLVEYFNYVLQKGQGYNVLYVICYHLDRQLNLRNVSKPLFLTVLQMNSLKIRQCWPKT